MCGINGIVAKNKVVKIEQRIRKMNDSLAHRGPNASGIISPNECVVLGHRRLSILDLNERSNQPMQLHGGRFVLVFNGEIYNYKEIRSELKQQHTFLTNGDTEVLLAGIEYRGLDWVLQQINGMYAFAAYDTQTGKTYLVRDRFGIKPLFYTFQNDVLLFSSEIKGILASGLVRPSFNADAIDEYLGYRYVREPFTFFREIYQVPAATYIQLDADLKSTKHLYWTLPPLNFDTMYDEEKVMYDTKKQLEEAIKRWSIADVRVGAYLSGGVDSSLTSAILSNNSQEKIDTYTIGFKEKSYNEFVYAQLIADQYNTRHHVLQCDQKDYFRDWERLISFKDAPLGVPNEIPLAQMSSALKKDMTVVISGEGADELFGGYGKIYRAAFDYKNHSSTESFYSYFIKQYEYVDRSIRDRYLHTSKKLRAYYDEHIQKEFEQHKNEENIFRFFQHYHIQGLLQRVDMTTMQTSVEARPPFLDYTLVEYVYRCVPYELKLRWNNAEAKQEATKLYAKAYSEQLDCPKYILKRVAEFYLPQNIVYRKKMGFPVPLSLWFPNLKRRAERLLKDADWLNTAELNNLFEDLESNDRAGQLLWMFMNVQLFYNQYFTKNWIW